MRGATPPSTNPSPPRSSARASSAGWPRAAIRRSRPPIASSMRGARSFSICCAARARGSRRSTPRRRQTMKSAPRRRVNSSDCARTTHGSRPTGWLRRIRPVVCARAEQRPPRSGRHLHRAGARLRALLHSHDGNLPAFYEAVRALARADRAERNRVLRAQAPSAAGKPRARAPDDACQGPGACVAAIIGRLTITTTKALAHRRE